MRRIAHQGQARRNSLRHTHQAQGEGRRWRQARQTSKHLVAGFANPVAKQLGGKRAQGVGVGIGRRPHDGDSIPRQRQVGQHAIIPEPLEGTVPVRSFGSKVGHDPLLAVRSIDRRKTSRLTHPGIAPVRTNE